MKIVKALVVMFLAAIGAASLHAGLTSYSDQGFAIAVGVFCLLGALFLYRHWFVNK